MPDFLLRDVDVIAVSLCKKGANGKRFFLKKMGETDKGHVTVEAPLLKLDADDWRVVYSVVAEPGNEEKAGVGAGADPTKTDMWADEQEILKAAHGFMRKGGLINFQHASMEPVGRVVENFVSPTDFATVDPSGTPQTIKKGAWVIGIEPNDDLRKLIDLGEVDSVSYEGTGFRSPLEKADPAKGAAYRKCKGCGGKIGYDAGKCQNCGKAYVAKGLTPEDDTVTQGPTLLEKIAVKLGILPEASVKSPEEDIEVPLTDQEKAALAKVEGIEAKITEFDTKVSALDGKLDTMLSRLPEPTKSPEEEREELTKSLATITESANDIQARLAKLEEGGSTQGSAADLQKNLNITDDERLAMALFGD